MFWLLFSLSHFQCCISSEVWFTFPGRTTKAPISQTEILFFGDKCSDIFLPPWINHHGDVSTEFNVFIFLQDMVEGRNLWRFYLEMRGGVYNGSVRQTSYNFRRKRKPRFSLFLYSFSPVWTSGQNLQFYILQFLLKWYKLITIQTHYLLRGSAFCCISTRSL